MRGFLYSFWFLMTVIHSGQFALEGEKIEGTIPLSELGRLHDLLASTEGSMVWKLSSGIDKLERPWLFVDVEGEVQLVCQRCLKPMPFFVNVGSTLVQFPDEAHLNDAENADEDLEGIVIDPELDVIALIEDEILLALPFASRHEDCGADRIILKDSKPNPFAVLAQLKTREAE
ncbi:YceD family protein [Iodobacter arcticus]|uniref:Large ribosomal RNA subunit accumulation protein YceD n=1 Tax=Iodobacter arcticus TaxID=590593 RepID=A0ABW2QU74_9NEIS